MWKRLAMTAAAVLGLAAPMVAKADEPCEQQTQVQTTAFFERGHTQPTYAQPFYGRDFRDNYWRMRERRRFERARRWESMREHRYGRRW